MDIYLFICSREYKIVMSLPGMFGYVIKKWIKKMAIERQHYELSEFLCQTTTNTDGYLLKL